MKTSYPNFIIVPELEAQALINCSEGNQFRIMPIPLTDGRFAVSSDVLSESEGIYAHIFSQINLHDFDQISFEEMKEFLPGNDEEEDI